MELWKEKKQKVKRFSYEEICVHIQATKSAADIDSQIKNFDKESQLKKTEKVVPTVWLFYVDLILGHCKS